MITPDAQFIQCDSCKGMIRIAAIKNAYGAESTGWTFAQKAEIIPVEPTCRLIAELRHSCANPDCQKKLLDWART